MQSLTLKSTFKLEIENFTKQFLKKVKKPTWCMYLVLNDFYEAFVYF